MSPKERLLRYFELSHKKSLKAEEVTELCHLEEELVDDMEGLLPDNLEKLLWEYIKETIELLCGPYAVIDTGSSWNVMRALLECALPRLNGRERLYVADTVGGKIALAGGTGFKARREFIKSYDKKKEK